MKRRKCLAPKIIKGHGDLLARQMNYRGISILKMCKALDVDQEYLLRLLENEEHITIEMAQKLSKILGNSRNFWINAEIQYCFNKILSS